MAGLRGFGVQRDSSGNGTTPKGLRHALKGLLRRDSAGTVVGVLVDDMTPVVSGTGQMSYQVRAFQAVTKATEANGPVISANDAPVLVATDPAPAVSSRIDTIYALQRHVTGDGGTGDSNAFEIAVAIGATDANPTPPALPSGALPLHDALVTAGATSTSGLTFTQRHEWTTLNGGALPVAKGARSFSLWNGTENLAFDLLRVGVKGLSEAQMRKLRLVVLPPADYKTNGSGDASAPLGNLAFTGGLVLAVPVDTLPISTNYGIMTLRWTAASSSSSNITFRALGASGGGGGLPNITVRVAWLVLGYDA